MKVLTQSRVLLLMEIEGGVSTYWPMTLVFLMLMVRANSLQACESLSISPGAPTQCGMRALQHLQIAFSSGTRWSLWSWTAGGQG